MIATIGHSTRTAEQFLSLLHAHGVTGLADVRTMPRSQRHPHFSRESLSRFLPAHGIVYVHLPGLGGLRKPRPDSPNGVPAAPARWGESGGWRHEAFRGYADHMQTREFSDALTALMTFAESRLGAIMCAEEKWWQCHRQLIADALVARGIDVRHIMSAAEATPHELTPFARLTGTNVSYPALV